MVGMVMVTRVGEEEGGLYGGVFAILKNLGLMTIIYFGKYCMYSCNSLHASRQKKVQKISRFTHHCSFKRSNTTSCSLGTLLQL